MSTLISTFKQAMNEAGLKLICMKEEEICKLNLNQGKELLRTKFHFQVWK